MSKKPKVQYEYRIGVIAGACPALAHVNSTVKKRMGVRAGDYLQIDSADGCARITRRIGDCDCCIGGGNEFVYVDEASLQYLNIAPDQPIKVKTSELQLSVP